MLIITNRKPTNSTDGNAFSAQFNQDSNVISAMNATKIPGGDGAAGWAISQIVAPINNNDAAIAEQIKNYIHLAKSLGRRVLVYVHGNGYDFLKGLERCDALSSEYGNVEIIGFSWPSEGFAPKSEASLTQHQRDMNDDDAISNKFKFINWVDETEDRYAQALLNATSSANALEKALRLVNTALENSDAETGSLAIHSLGGLMFYQAVTQSNEPSLCSAFANILLLAPDIKADIQNRLLDSLTPKRVYVTFNRGDWVLAAAQAADRGTKLGLDPGDGTALSKKAIVRYVDFGGATKGCAGHRYFIDPQDMGVETTKRFFTRTFGGLADFNPLKEDSTIVYPFHCADGGKVCWMGNRIDTTFAPG